MKRNNGHPQSPLDEIISDLMNDLPLEERVRVANLDQDDLKVLEAVLAKYIGYSLDQFNEQGNDELLNECRAKSGDKSMDDAGAAVFVLQEFWKRLRDTHRVRMVK